MNSVSMTDKPSALSWSCAARAGYEVHENCVDVTSAILVMLTKHTKMTHKAPKFIESPVEMWRFKQWMHEK